MMSAHYETIQNSWIFEWSWYNWDTCKISWVNHFRSHHIQMVDMNKWQNFHSILLINYIMNSFHLENLIEQKTCLIFLFRDFKFWYLDTRPDMSDQDLIILIEEKAKLMLIINAARKNISKNDFDDINASQSNKNWW